MRVFRNRKPQRTYSGAKKKDYRKYRNALARDFNNRCGYTDCSNFWWGGFFHIDHFAPQKPKIDDLTKLEKFKELECEYNNLVYVCPQVNRAKSNDWASDDPAVSIVGNCGYLHPCDVDFNEYFERTDTGGIRAKNHPIAEYMWRRLRLYLMRYELYWGMQELMERKSKLLSFDELPGLTEKIQEEIRDAIVDLEREYSSYWKYLSVNYPQID